MIFVLLSGGDRTGWYLRGVLTHALLCHRLRAASALLPVLLFSVMASGQLEWKCKGEREKRQLQESRRTWEERVLTLPPEAELLWVEQPNQIQY